MLIYMNNFSSYFKHQILNKHPSWTLFLSLTFYVFFTDNLYLKFIFVLNFI